MKAAEQTIDSKNQYESHQCPEIRYGFSGILARNSAFELLRNIVDNIIGVKFKAKESKEERF